ncbi:MAG: GTP-binding protein [Chthoniobacterales bacterium]
MPKSEQFQTWAFESRDPFDRERLVEMVRRELPETVFRCKGIVGIRDDPGVRYALQVVGRRTTLEPLGEWGGRQRVSQVVAIGSEIDEADLKSRFEKCRVRDSDGAETT